MSCQSTLPPEEILKLYNRDEPTNMSDRTDEDFDLARRIVVLTGERNALREQIEKMRDASEKMLRALNKNTAHTDGEVLNYCLVCKAMSELRAALPSTPDEKK